MPNMLGGKLGTLAKPVVQAFIAISKKRIYPAKYNVVRAGDEPQAIYLVLEGSVTVLVDDEDGREMILSYLNAGDFFGEMCLFPDQNVRTAIVRTRTSSMIAELSFQGFRNFNRVHPEIMYEVAGQMARRLGNTNQQLRDLTFVDVAGRIAGLLLKLGGAPDAKSNAEGVVIRISRLELANLAGCSRAMAGRVLIKMQEDGLIMSQGRNIFIPNGPGIGGGRKKSSRLG